MKVTRVACSADLNAGKYAQLEEQARRLGQVRAKVRREYGSVSGSGISDRAVRDRWMADGTAAGFGALANAWKETARDAMGDIRASREAAKVKARQAASRRSGADAERKRLFTALKADTWAADPYLSRMMRKHRRRGRTKVANQIVVRSDQYKTFAVTEGGNVWLAVPGLERRQLVKIPLNATVAPAGTVRLILRGGKVEVHYQAGGASLKSSARPHGGRRIGVGKGYTEVLTETFEAVHAVTDKASVIVAEDLTRSFTGRKKLGKNRKQR